MPLPPPYHLREVAVPIVENNDCERKYRGNSSWDSNTRIIKDDMLCAGTQGRDSCQVRARLSSPLSPFLAQDTGTHSPWHHGMPGMLIPVFSYSKTPGAPWCAGGTAPGSRWVWSAGAEAVDFLISLVYTPE